MCAALAVASDLQAADVSGVVRSVTGDAVPNVVVNLNGSTASPVSTDRDGTYAFSSIVDSDVDVVPSKSGDGRSAITAIDAVWALQIAVGMHAASEAERQACDVNGSGSITAFDAVLILQYIVGLISRLPVAGTCGSDWAFTPTTPTGGTPVLPGSSPASCRRGAIAMRPLTGSISGQAFTARLFGDCNGSWRNTTPTPTPTSTPTASASASPTPTPTASPSASASASPTPTRTSTPTRSATRTTTATATLTPTTVPSSGPSLGGCPMFPTDNDWNRDISGDPADTNSSTFVTALNALGGSFLHADFGSPADYGIPYVVVPASQPPVSITFVDYGDESDPGPYPVPTNAPVEAGSDHHVLVVRQSECKLYELYNASKDAVGSGWSASSGAIFDLRSNALRPDSWTSADAAGLPILPGLVRYDEVAAGEIRHALRFTVMRARRAWVHPATHYGISNSTSYPPMGARFRLKPNYDISGFTGQARIVMVALQRYGMFVADQGANWYISGATDPRWDDEDLDQLKAVPSTAFEVVQLGTVHLP